MAIDNKQKLEQRIIFNFMIKLLLKSVITQDIKEKIK